MNTGATSPQLQTEADMLSRANFPQNEFFRRD